MNSYTRNLPIVSDIPSTHFCQCILSIGTTLQIRDISARILGKHRAPLIKDNLAM